MIEKKFKESKSIGKPQQPVTAQSISITQESISKIVALVSELQSVDKEKDAASSEIKELKQKMDKGDLPKFSYLQLVDKKKLRINDLNHVKKELKEKLTQEMNGLRNGLVDLKELMQFRAHGEKIGDLQ